MTPSPAITPFLLSPFLEIQMACLDGWMDRRTSYAKHADEAEAEAEARGGCLAPSLQAV